MSYADTDGSTLKKISDGVSVSLQHVVLLRLGGVLARIIPCGVVAVPRVKGKHVDCTRVEDCQIRVMWIYPLIIGLKSALKSHTLRILAIALE